MQKRKTLRLRGSRKYSVQSFIGSGGGEMHAMCETVSPDLLAD